MKSFLQTAIAAANASAEAIRSYYRGEFTVELESDQTPVTVADRKAEDIIRSMLLDAFPDHDLYFSDGSSFVDSIYLLLDTAPTASNNRRLLNVNPTVSAERQRRDYWLQY